MQENFHTFYIDIRGVGGRVFIDQGTDVMVFAPYAGEIGVDLGANIRGNKGIRAFWWTFERSVLQIGIRDSPVPINPTANWEPPYYMAASARCVKR